MQRNRSSMFHKFSATPATAPSQSKRSRLAGVNNGGDASSNTSTDRQKTSRACDRCRQLRIKCNEQKPCVQCVGIKAKCTVSYAPLPASQANSREVESSSSINPQSYNQSTGGAIASSSDFINTSSQTDPPIPPFSLGISQASSGPTSSPPDDLQREFLDIASQVQGTFASEQPAFSYTSALAGNPFPQLPHHALPSGDRFLALDTLLRNQRSYYLRLFWDVCHPLIQFMSETEFAKLNALPSPTLFDEYSVENGLVDAMIALGIQHSHATGLTGRILGLQHSSSQQHTTNSPEAGWPGFDHFYRCRECMRTKAEVTLEALRCHALLIIYLIKGNAFHEAYNLLGTTIRKAYIANFHRPPPNHLSEDEKTARLQVWWFLFSLDVQCSLQLDMPTASQRHLVKCPFPAEDALDRYVSSPSQREEIMHGYTYSTRVVNFAIAVADINACVSTADLIDDGSNPAALENHALNLSSALRDLEAWRDKLPTKSLLSQQENGSGNVGTLDFDRVLDLPAWLQRQTVLLELQYHNAYTLIQRPFIRLRNAHSGDAGGRITTSAYQQPYVELQIASAVNHAITTIDTVFTICSMSDILYGWPEVLQSLWNATVTIIAYVYGNSLSSMVSQALKTLKRSNAVLEFFSPSCPTALSAKTIVQSLATYLDNMIAQGSFTVPNDGPMDWDTFTTLLEE